MITDTHHTLIPFHKTAETLLRQRELLPEDMAAFESLGFHLFNDSGDALALEYESVYQAEANGQPHRSFNLHVIFEWADQELVVHFGKNDGDGFDPEFTETAKGDASLFTGVIDQTGEANKHLGFLQLIMNHWDAATRATQQLRDLDVLLGRQQAA